MPSILRMSKLLLLLPEFPSNYRHSVTHWKNATTNSKSKVTVNDENQVHAMLKLPATE